MSWVILYTVKIQLWYIIKRMSNSWILPVVVFDSYWYQWISHRTGDTVMLPWLFSPLLYHSVLSERCLWNMTLRVHKGAIVHLQFSVLDVPTCLCCFLCEGTPLSVHVNYTGGLKCKNSNVEAVCLFQARSWNIVVCYIAKPRMWLNTRGDFTKR